MNLTENNVLLANLGNILKGLSQLLACLLAVFLLITLNNLTEKTHENHKMYNNYCVFSRKIVGDISTVYMSPSKGPKRSWTPRKQFEQVQNSLDKSKTIVLDP